MSILKRAAPLGQDFVLIRAVRRVAGGLENICAFLLAVMFGLCVTLVILRYGFRLGFAGAEELMRYLFVYTTALGASVAVLRGDHIRISVVVGALPPAWAGWVNRLRHLLVFGCNGCLAWLSLKWIAQVGGNRSAGLDLPLWVIQVSVPVGMVLVMLCSLAALFSGECREQEQDVPQEDQA